MTTRWDEPARCWCGDPREPGAVWCPSCARADAVDKRSQAREAAKWRDGRVCERCAAFLAAGKAGLCPACVADDEGWGAGAMARKASLAGAREAAKHVESSRRRTAAPTPAATVSQPGPPRAGGAQAGQQTFCVDCGVPTDWACGERFPSGSDGWIFPFCDECKTREREAAKHTESQWRAGGGASTSKEES